MPSTEDVAQKLRAALTHLPEDEKKNVETALDIAIKAHGKQKRSDGSPYVTHPIEVAMILAEWGADAETIMAGLLHDTLEDTPLSLGEIKEHCGRDVTFLVEGVTKFTKADFEGEASLDRKIETLRKLFEVMRRDIRVIIIKLADRLHNMRTLSGLPKDRQKRFAEETIAIYYKLAFHLGMNDLRRELSELSLPAVHPRESKSMMDFRRTSGEKGRRVCAEMEKNVRAHDENNALLSMQTLARSLYSLRRERSRTGGMRQGYVIEVLARDRDACYDLLKLFHTLYRPVRGEFHDYIAAPTENSYQTIRTAVIGPDNEFVYLRIRTDAMAQQENRGVLLKCFGKEREEVPGFSWLKREESLDLATRESSSAFWEALQSDIFQETIHITVDGEDLSVPLGATVLDAIYVKHGEEAHRTVSATVNGADRSLAEALAEGDVVHTTMDDLLHASFDWLQWTTTKFARALIVDALKAAGMSQKTELGKRLLQREMDRHKKGGLGDLTKGQLQNITKEFQREDFNDVLSLIGEGTLRAGDVVSFLYPEHKRRSLFTRKWQGQEFRIRITGIQERKRDVLPKVHALLRLSEADISKADMQYDVSTRTFRIILRGRSDSRAQLAGLIDVLERQSWISSVETTFSLRQKIFFGLSLALAFGIVFLDVALLPAYEATLGQSATAWVFLLRTLPLLPIIGVNYFLLRLLQRYTVRMRRDKWFFGLAFFLNVIGLLLVIARMTSTGTAQSLLPLVVVFLVSMFYVGYRFLQMETLFSGVDQTALQPLSDEKWRALKKKKITGYLIRFGAVIIWGIQPLYLRYTPANEVDPLMLVFFIITGNVIAAGAILGVSIAIQKIRKAKKMVTLHIQRNKEFFSIIIGAAIFTYFLSASLQITTSTNFILFNNFSPVLTLLLATVLWRKSIPYLKDPRHTFWIFIIFLMGSTGSTLIIYNSVYLSESASLSGDILALVAMAADVLYVLGQIRYMKKFPNTPGASLVLHVTSALILLLLPIIVYLALSGSAVLFSLSLVPALYALGAGLLSGIGNTLNGEAFRRVDGFIAFLMFNISILITFIVEVFFLGKFTPTWVLIVGGLIIICSTIAAEMINSRCQRRGL